jgi:hypothetical protein
MYFVSLTLDSMGVLIGLQSTMLKICKDICNTFIFDSLMDLVE